MGKASVLKHLRVNAGKGWVNCGVSGRPTCENSGMLVIHPDAHAALRRHGEEAYPEESCGVLVGSFRDGASLVMAAVRCDNARRDSPEIAMLLIRKSLLEFSGKLAERD